MIIRNEEKRDYQAVEALTRKAFYNLYVPGCVEHYLVHIMRNHKDFIPELDFVLELNQEIIGNIMYTKAHLTDEQGIEKEDPQLLALSALIGLSKKRLWQTPYGTFF